MNVIFAQDDRVVAFDWGEGIELRDTETGALIESWTAPPDHHIRLYDLSKDGSKIAIRRNDGLYVYHIPSPIRWVEWV